MCLRSDDNSNGETSMKHTFMAAALAAVCAITTSASAADLGGNCCADLEERVAELEATTARKGNRKVSLTIYGEVNQAIIWADAGGSTDWVAGNNNNSTSRFGFRGEAKAGALTAGYLLEIGVGGFSEDGTPGADLSVRHSAVYIGGSVGRLTAGLTSRATDGVAETTVVNTVVASKLLSWAHLGDGEVFDGARGAVVRYDSPSLGGFILSGSVNSGKGNGYDGALKYAGEGAGFKLAASIGYSHEVSVTFKNDFFGILAGTEVEADSRYAGSASLQHIASGLFVNAAYGQLNGVDNLGGADIKAYHAQAGIEHKFTGMGATTLYGEWMRYDLDVLGQADAYGAGLVQAIDAAALDLYISGRHVPDMDLTLVMAGARIKF